MRAHPAPIRSALLAGFLHVRTMDVTDEVVHMLLEMRRRLDPQPAPHLQQELLRDSRRVAGKGPLLSRVAEAVSEEPDGTMRAVLLPHVKEETVRALAADAKASGPPYRLWYQDGMRQKSSQHDRQLRPWVLAHLALRSENRFQPVMEAVAVLQPALATTGHSCPDDGPLDGVGLPRWRDPGMAERAGQVRINRQYDALCVRQRLERAWQGKEVGVEGA